MNRYGVYGEQTIIPAAMTVTHPNSLSWEHAARDLDAVHDGLRCIS